ncbi:putative bifunctional diguanylate cyclase/phosphodiesterase [Terriglobus roseus]|uniref:putative bifunctional diguanylate cyclase/phosphodiesterase n=1 Tax=Terriglobus roseus TaxID=392734 RepID=UPI0002F231EF|nr:bifunctional diguanylate cyclase/phosphodiesterase [Terriglobus roseus]
MEANLFDLALLSVLILFFGILQSHRSQREYRMWLVAWIVVMASMLVYSPALRSTGWQMVTECMRVDLLVLGGLVFLLSFVEQQTSRNRLIRDIALLWVPCCVLLNLLSISVAYPWLCVAVILAGETVVMYLAEQLVPEGLPRQLIRLEGLLGTVALLVAVWSGNPSMALSVVLAEVFIACAILLSVSRNSDGAGKWTSVSGFVAWGVLYAIYQMTDIWPSVSIVLGHTWSLPKYMVGFGMILMVVEDDTERISSLSEEYRLLYESNPHPMFIFDPATARFLSANDAAAAAYGYKLEEFLTMTLFDIRPTEDHQKLALELAQLHGGRQIWRHRRKNGEVFEVEITGHDVSFGGTKARFSMCIDITERERLNRELIYSAQHDVLTGLANRLLLEERAQQALARAARDGSKMAILTIDVDRFKQVNDTYGHMVGDECLKGIAARLMTRVREADTLARTGGEEFTVLIGGLTSTRGAQAAAASLLGTLVKPLTLSDNEIAVSVSIGVAVYPDDGADLETIRKRSDKALYAAKRMGGGRALMTTDEQAGEEESAVNIESALRDALQTGGLELVYQPIFDATGRFARVEALVRGRGDYLRKVGPGAFIPVAEESGLIVSLGRWVLEEACRQMADWRERNLPVFDFAVNISARQLVQADYTDSVLQTLERYGIPPALLHLELTETTLMGDFSAMARIMKRLSEAGVLFSIDDFGTGYSSLARLSELPISTLKIDRSFVMKLLESEAAVGIVRAIVNMSRHLRLEVVAEGVERPEHIKLLLALGCHKFQGFYLSRPLSPEALEAAAFAGDTAFDPSPFRGYVPVEDLDAIVSA